MNGHKQWMNLITLLSRQQNSTFRVKGNELSFNMSHLETGQWYKHHSSLERNGWIVKSDYSSSPLLLSQWGLTPTLQAWKVSKAVFPLGFLSGSKHLPSKNIDLYLILFNNPSLSNNFWILTVLSRFWNLLGHKKSNFCACEVPSRHHSKEGLLSPELTWPSWAPLLGLPQLQSFDNSTSHSFGLWEQICIQRLMGQSYKDSSHFIQDTAPWVIVAPALPVKGTKLLPVSIVPLLLPLPNPHLLPLSWVIMNLEHCLISTLLSCPLALYLRTCFLGNPTWDTAALENLSRQGWSLGFFFFSFFVSLPPNRLSLSSSLFLKAFQLANCQFSWWLSTSQECILMRIFLTWYCLDNLKEWSKNDRKRGEDYYFDAGSFLASTQLHH